MTLRPLAVVPSPRSQANVTSSLFASSTTVPRLAASPLKTLVGRLIETISGLGLANTAPSFVSLFMWNENWLAVASVSPVQFWKTYPLAGLAITSTIRSSR